MEFQLSYFKSWKMMMWKCCTQAASKFGKLSSARGTGKGQFSFQFQRKKLKAKSLQSCPTLCDPTDSSPPGSSVPGILQARTLEWAAISFSNACMLSHLSHVWHCVTLWTAAHQVPPSTGFFRQEYWSGLPFPSPNPKECSNYCTNAVISHASKVMLKILQARLQQYMNCELPDVQAGFRKGRGTRHQIANIRWIIKKAREFQKNIYFFFIDYTKAFDCVDYNKLCKTLKEMGIPDHLTCLLKNLYMVKKQ